MICAILIGRERSSGFPGKPELATKAALGEHLEDDQMPQAEFWLRRHRPS